MAGKSATLVIQVLAETQKAAQGITVFGKKLDTGMVAKAAAVGAAFVVAAGAVVKMTQAAADDAAEHERLVKAYESAGAATGDYAATIDEAVAAGQALAFTDTEIRDALVPLIAASGDAAQANKDLALAQDIARLKSVPLETAAKAVAKAQLGSATALAKLVGVNAAGKESTDVLADAQRIAAGQAETYGQTTKGQSEAMKIGFDELQETIGSAFLPVVQAIMPLILKLAASLQKVADWMGKNKTATLIIIGVLGALVAIIGTAVVITKTMSAVQTVLAAKTGIVTAAQWLWNTALAANPIGIVVIAIAALVAGLILAYQKSETFRRIVNAAFEWVKRTVTSVVDTIVGAWEGLTGVLTAPFEALMDIVDTVRGGIGGVLDILPGGKSTPGAPAVAMPMARGIGPAPTASVPSGSLPAAGAKLRADVTHHIDDPRRALAGLPGGAAEVARLLNKGADASGLYRNLQQAAGVR